MNALARLLTLCLAALTVSVEAKTSKYDLEPFFTQPGFIQYPRLDLSKATSVVYTINRSAPLFEPQLSSLEITFADAAKLTATNFKLVDNKYRAIVNGAWIYKEVIVEVDRSPFDARHPSSVSAYVSERTAFINPQVENQNPTGLLFSVSGTLRDITPARIIDSVAAVIAGKKVTLSLRDRLQVNPDSYSNGSFVVDAVWYGKGAKTIYLDAALPPPELNAIEVVGLEVNGTNDFDRTVSVNYKDRNGMLRPSNPVLLKDALDRAYSAAPAP